MNANESKGVLAVLAHIQAASPGPWETDTESNDAGFHSYVMTDANGSRMFDSLNAEACVETEIDDDAVYRWDVTAQRNFNAVSAAVEFVRLHGAAIAELIEAANDYMRPDLSLAATPAADRRLRAALARAGGGA